MMRGVNALLRCLPLPKEDDDYMMLKCMSCGLTVVPRLNKRGQQHCPNCGGRSFLPPGIVQVSPTRFEVAA
ncbi:hypothetical protein UFOVP1339_21 [uncultured Caudovirales phage]|uniref:Uncharacterized protein n=1 Tax=uncultured Caudovirales phage TaxID=2100421 RepID=A0A6J5RVJ4_9CAUD|nr:hypothetical protein UFOVP1339_21 [uncultured Caudovirales phage]